MYNLLGHLSLGNTGYLSLGNTGNIQFTEIKSLSSCVVTPFCFLHWFITCICTCDVVVSARLVETENFD